MKTHKIITIALLVCMGIFSCEKDSTESADILGCTNELSSNYDSLATADDGTCIVEVGMEAYGGIVALIDDSGTSGLVVAHSDYTNGQTFNSSTDFGWRQNEALNICADLSMNGYDDWILPSYDTLSMIYTFFHLEGYGDFRDDNRSTSAYLSSSTDSTEQLMGMYEDSDGNWVEDWYTYVYPLAFNFSSGDQAYYSGPRGSEYYRNFRPVRYFP